MTRTEISKNPSGRIIAASPYALVLVSKVKTIEGHRWHPVGKYRSFRKSNGVIDLQYIRELFGHKSSKTTEIYTHVSNKDLMKIKNPLDQILGTKGGGGI